MSQGRRPELVGGGLIRSSGGWSQVLALGGKRIKVASDERILGSSECTLSLLPEAEARGKEMLRLCVRLSDLALPARDIVKDEGITESELRSGSSQESFYSRKERPFHF